ncbi:MAG: GvpL/GvpF family gas vesicle protein [Pseudomonadota bacterium]
MKYELLALLSGHYAAPSDADLVTVARGDYTAVFLPRSHKQLFGQTLRRTRLSSAPKRQAHLETLMSKGTVLPFAPATVFDPQGTDALVASNAEVFRTLFERLRNRVQYQISVEWTESRVLEQFRNTSEISPLFAGSSVSGRTVSAAVTKLADRLGQCIVSRLSSIACEFSELPRQRALIANCVILIEATEEPALDEALAAIDAIWSDGLRIRQIGPGPAVSFATLTLQRFGKRDLARAHRVLNLSDRPSSDEIRDARQRRLRDASATVSEIRMAARLALAAHKIGDPGQPVHIVDIWSEGRATTGDLERVA